MTDKLTDITLLYVEAFRSLNGRKPIPVIDVRFYPYIGINHTIRVRGGKIFVRIAEICRDAPSDVQESLAGILVRKLLGKTIPADIAAPYRKFSKTETLRERALENKRVRGRKIITAPEGFIYDLNQIFERLNILYFENKIPKPTLSWSKDRTYRILGHHDSTHETIVVSRSLDDAKVPDYVVEYVVFHEMLHILHPVRTNDAGRRFIHTPQFKRDEKKFAFFDEAESWISKNLRALKRKNDKRF